MNKDLKIEGVINAISASSVRIGGSLLFRKNRWLPNTSVSLVKKSDNRTVILKKRRGKDWKFIGEYQVTHETYCYNNPMVKLSKAGKNGKWFSKEGYRESVEKILE